MQSIHQKKISCFIVKIPFLRVGDFRLVNEGKKLLWKLMLIIVIVLLFLRARFILIWSFTNSWTKVRKCFKCNYQIIEKNIIKYNSNKRYTIIKNYQRCCSRIKCPENCRLKSFEKQSSTILSNLKIFRETKGKSFKYWETHHSSSWVHQISAIQTSTRKKSHHKTENNKVEIESNSSKSLLIIRVPVALIIRAANKKTRRKFSAYENIEFR